MKFFRDYNPIALIKDIRLHRKLNLYFNDLKHSELWDKYGMMEGWFGKYGLLLTVDHPNQYNEPTGELLRNQAKKNLLPIIDFIIELSPDVQNDIGIKLIPTQPYGTFKVIIYYDIRFLELKYWLKMIFTAMAIIATIIII